MAFYMEHPRRKPHVHLPHPPGPSALEQLSDYLSSSCGSPAAVEEEYNDPLYSRERNVALEEERPIPSSPTMPSSWDETQEETQEEEEEQDYDVVLKYRQDATSYDVDTVVVDPRRQEPPPSPQNDDDSHSDDDDWDVVPRSPSILKSPRSTTPRPKQRNHRVRWKDTVTHIPYENDDPNTKTTSNPNCCSTHCLGTQDEEGRPTVFARPDDYDAVQRRQVELQVREAPLRRQVEEEADDDPITSFRHYTQQVASPVMVATTEQCDDPITTFRSQKITHEAKDPIASFREKNVSFGKKDRHKVSKPKKKDAAEARWSYPSPGQLGETSSSSDPPSESRSRNRERGHKTSRPVDPSGRRVAKEETIETRHDGATKSSKAERSDRGIRAATEETRRQGTKQSSKAEPSDWGLRVATEETTETRKRRGSKQALSSSPKAPSQVRERKSWFGKKSRPPTPRYAEIVWKSRDDDDDDDTPKPPTPKRTTRNVTPKTSAEIVWKSQGEKGGKKQSRRVPASPRRFTFDEREPRQNAREEGGQHMF